MDPGRFSNQDSSPGSMRGHRGIRRGDGEKSTAQQGSEGVHVNNCDHRESNENPKSRDHATAAGEEATIGAFPHRWL